MRMHQLKAGLAAGATLAVGLTLAMPGLAGADTAARTGDVVGVGSDTVQNASDFLWDGAPGVAGGYNNIGNLNRVWSFDATGDANGRAVYDGTCGTPSATTGLGTFCDSTNNQAPNLLGGSVVLRAGTKPVVRPNGSGAGYAALIADSAAPGYKGLAAGSIQFSRGSRLPNATEEGNCPTTNAACGGLHVYQVATDQLGIAHVKTGFDGPAGLSAAQLIKIYQCQDTTWDQVGGTSTATIHPLIPQSGSGTRSFFLSDLQAANGGNAITLGACVRTVEEHDPTGIYSDPSPADAIEPFSAGKIALINSGYFANGVSYSGTGGATAYTPNYLTLESGTPSDGGTNYNSTRGLYFAIRQADLASTTPFQPGGTENWAQTLFVGSSSWIARASSGAQIAAAGFTQAYKDCGINPTTC